MTPKLRIHLLGPPKVEWAGRALDIPRRQVRALLYRLAARLQPIPREHLCFLFWPDTPDSTSRRNLSHLLTHLRRALPSPEVLLTPDDRVNLDPQQVWSDVVTFDRLCATLSYEGKRSATLQYEGKRSDSFQYERKPDHPRSAATPLELRPSDRSRHGSSERPSRTTRIPDRVDALQQAVDLYRGPFLDGFSLPTNPEFETWITQERSAWEHLYLQALGDLIEEYVARDERDAAIACAQRYLATDDLAEDVHRRLISLYAEIGDRNAALRQFERCAAALERELGVSPLPATRAAYQAVLEDRRPPPKRPTPWLTWTTLPSLDVPLVGRDEAWHRLEQAYAHARAGHGRVILISGEPGIGKSRLVQDFATHLQDQALVLAGAGEPGEHTLPYHPIAQALRSAANVERLTCQVQSIWLAEVSRLLPELRTVWPDLPPLQASTLAEPDEARTRLFEALYQTILELAGGPQPVILCLDDLHWADGATLDWLAYLGCRLRDSRSLILGTYRSEEAGALDGLRHTLARLGALSELELTGLNTASVLQLLRHLAGPHQYRGKRSDPHQYRGKRSGLRPGDEALADRLQRATGGNPFFLLEMLRALIETGQLDEDLTSLEKLPLPNTVRQAVEARLERLSPTARQVLEASAILGATFSFDLVRLTAGRRELEAMDALDELVGRHLLVERQTGYRFRHNLIRHVTQAGLGPVRRQLLHRRAGRALEQLDPDAVLALARHFDAGGDAEKALQYYAEAAHRAEALFAWREAEAYQSQMLQLLDRLDPSRTQPDCLAQRGQILAGRAHLRFLQGRLKERDADLAALAALAEASGDKRLRLQALVHRVRYLNLGGQYTEAIATAREGLRLADHVDDTSARYRLLAYVGFAHYFLGQPRPALAALESALDDAGEEADPETRGRIIHMLGYVHLHLGNYARAMAHNQDALVCNQQAGDHNRIAWNLLDIGFLHLKLGDFAEAEAHLNESLALAQQIGARPAEAYALTYLGYWDLYRGDYAAAANHLQNALLIQREVHSEHGCIAAKIGMGLAFCRLGQLAQARRQLQRAVERARSIAHRRRLAEALVGRGLVEVEAGQPAAALRCLIEAVAVARESECQESVAAGLAALAHAERQVVVNVVSLPDKPRGDLASALEHARNAVQVAQESALPMCETWGEMELGLTLLAQGEPEAALEHTERAVAMASQIHEGWIGTEQIHRAHAQVLQALDHTEVADEQIRLADAIVEDKAARIPDAERRQRYLRFVKRET